MNLHLKNIKINQRLSEETICYSADLYLDKKKIALVGNRGYGGPDDVTVLDKLAMEQAEKHVENLPPLEADFGDGKIHSLQMSLELLCHELLNNHIVTKEKARNDKRIEKFVKENIAKNSSQNKRTLKLIFKDNIRCIGVSEKSKPAQEMVDEYNKKNTDKVISFEEFPVA